MLPSPADSWCNPTNPEKRGANPLAASGPLLPQPERFTSQMTSGLRLRIVS